jgi:hypothetical protein
MRTGQLERRQLLVQGYVLCSNGARDALASNIHIHTPSCKRHDEAHDDYLPAQLSRGTSRLLL